MSIELDWQLINEDAPQPEKPSLPLKPRSRRPHHGLFALVLLPILVVAVAIAYMVCLYRMRLDCATKEIRPIVALEAQAIAVNDRNLFLALQDPEDVAWRSLQEHRFTQLERSGLPEFGWQVTSGQPVPGRVTLEPGGARLDMTYHLTVAEPLLDGPVNVELHVPQFYRFTPSGWVRAMPDAEFWGVRQTLAGKRFTLTYFQRDADVLEPFTSKMDQVLDRACRSLPCPSRPIHVIFENTADSLANLSDFSYGFDDGVRTLTFPSPHLFGLPADARSRNELYRAIGTRVVQALVYEAASHQVDWSHPFSQAILRWELAQAGLARPLVTGATSHTLGDRFWTEWQPLEVISLQTLSADTNTQVALLPFALSFVEERFGPGSVVRLMPAMTYATLGQVLQKVMEIDPATLESGWLAYLRRQAGLSVADATVPAPVGEFALVSAFGASPSGLCLGSVDEAEQVEITSVDTIGFLPVWSPCGANLAYASMQDMVQPTVRVQVMDAASQQVKTAADGLNSANLGWLPDGDLWVKEPGLVHLINHDTSETVAIAGTNRTWSPDGTRIAYVATGSDQVPTVQIADAYGRGTRSIAPGYGPVWSPDGGRLAFWGGVQPDPTCPTGRKLLAAKIQVADAASGSVMTLARSRDLLQSAQNDLNSDQAFMLGDIAWSPDGAFLAVTLKLRDSSPLLLVLSTNSGAIHARFGGWDTSHDVWSWIGLLPRQAWSPNGRYVAFWLAPASAWYDEAGKVGIMDIRTGQSVMLPCVGDAAWLPSGRWLAAPQQPSGILLVTPDLAEARWLDTPRAESIVWRPQP